MCVGPFLSGCCWFAAPGDDDSGCELIALKEKAKVLVAVKSVPVLVFGTFPEDGEKESVSLGASHVAHDVHTKPVPKDEERRSTAVKEDMDVESDEIAEAGRL
ncbi:uncharacterized protein [Physcomitrium patens]|uniref:uncharacterized protein n=1 Tax=Physcomitrium patens TaxID=3218 RepID=UPI003CCC99C3